MHFHEIKTFARFHLKNWSWKIVWPSRIKRVSSDVGLEEEHLDTCQLPSLGLQTQAHRDENDSKLRSSAMFAFEWPRKMEKLSPLEADPPKVSYHLEVVNSCIALEKNSVGLAISQASGVLIPLVVFCLMTLSVFNRSEYFNSEKIYTHHS